MENKNLDSPGPLSSHIGPVHEHIYTPVIPSKNNVYTDRSNRKPLEEGEIIVFPCNASVTICSLYRWQSAFTTEKKDSDCVLSADISSSISISENTDGSTNILIRKDSIPLLIETLQRALLSFEK